MNYFKPQFNLYWILGLVLSFASISGCTTLFSGPELYYQNIKPLDTLEFELTHESRLEQNSLAAMQSSAQQQCDSLGKFRYQILDQKSEYVNIELSQYATPHYRLITRIRCR